MSDPISLHNKIASACAGSLLTSIAVNPFDVVRVRMQQQSAVNHLDPPTKLDQKPKKLVLQPLKLNPNFKFDVVNPKLGVNLCCKDVFWYPTSISYCVAEQADLCQFKPKQTTFNTFAQICKQEGVFVLWRGVSLMLVQSLPANVVYYIVYEQLRDKLPVNQNIAPLTSGMLARTLASTLVSPIELLKTRLQSMHVPQNTHPMTLAVKSVRDMIKIDGYRALLSGLGLTLWRDVPFSGIYWMVVEYTRSKFKKTNSHFEKMCESLAAGILGGVCASILTTPFDVAKTRRQLGHASCTSAHMSIPKFMRTIVLNEGWSALFVGLAPRTMKVAPACAIMITSYEMGKRLL